MFVGLHHELGEPGNAEEVEASRAVAWQNVFVPGKEEKRRKTFEKGKENVEEEREKEDCEDR